MLRLQLPRIGVMLAVVGVLIASASLPCQACSCAQVTRVEAMGYADIVFRGTVVAVEDPQGDQATLSSDRPIFYTFAVDGVIKGDPAEELVVSTAAEGASCGASFVQGQRYEVMAYREGQDLSTGLCAGNTALAAAQHVTPPASPDATSAPTPLPAPTSEPTLSQPAAPADVGGSNVAVVAAGVGVLLAAGIGLGVHRHRSQRRGSSE